MITFPIGFVFVFGIFIYSMGLNNLGLYLNMHSILLVGGGTIAILLFASPSRTLKNLFTTIRNVFREEKHFSKVKSDLISLAGTKNKNITSKEELIIYAQDLWEQGVAPDMFVVLLSQRKQEIEHRSVESIQTLKNLAKYPPALGMAGTVMGIVTLFQSLDEGKEKIGPALALAMTATFFGLAIANAIVMPLSDRLQVRQLNDEHYLQNVYQVLLLINNGESFHIISEEVTQRAV